MVQLVNRLFNILMNILIVNLNYKIRIICNKLNNIKCYTNLYHFVYIFNNMINHP